MAVENCETCTGDETSLSDKKPSSGLAVASKWAKAGLELTARVAIVVVPLGAAAYFAKMDIPGFPEAFAIMSVPGLILNGIKLGKMNRKRNDAFPGPK
jgi:hypothetical protein